MANLRGNLVVNERAPVTAWQKYDLDKTRVFNNLAAFLDWYREDLHGDLKGRINTQFLFTDVLVNSLRDPPRGGGYIRQRRIGEDKETARPARTHGRHQKVEVDGVVYNSTWDAFQKLGLGGVKECVRFRGELKSNPLGEREFGGRKFKIIEG